MLQGMLDLLTNFANPQSKVSLDNFVFKIVPCLNPDGVSRGYWRNDTSGVNLNRYYKDTDSNEHPTIYSTMKGIRHAYEH